MCNFNVLLDYVDEVYKVFLDSNEETLDNASKALVDMTPAPMDTMLEKQPRGEAIAKMKQRKELVVVDVPPTAEGIVEGCSLYKIFKIFN